MKICRAWLLPFFMLLFIVGNIHSRDTSTESWQGTVVRVTDGDTYWVKRDKVHVKIRLFGIDCPENKQEYSQETTRFAQELVYFKDVTVEPLYTDTYGRTVALIYLENGVCVNEELVRKGMAWVYRRYCDRPECKKWIRLEAIAQTNRWGLWKGKDIVPPWEFRNNNQTQPLPPNDAIGLSVAFVVGGLLLFLIRAIQKRRWTKKKRYWKQRSEKIRREGNTEPDTMPENDYYRNQLELLKQKRRNYPHE